MNNGKEIYKHYQKSLLSNIIIIHGKYSNAKSCKQARKCWKIFVWNVKEVIDRFVDRGEKEEMRDWLKEGEKERGGEKKERDWERWREKKSHRSRDRDYPAWYTILCFQRIMLICVLHELISQTIWKKPDP